MAEIIELKHAGGVSELVVDSQLHDSQVLAAYCASIQAESYVVITDTKVEQALGREMFAALPGKVKVISVAPGETSKSLQQCERIIGQMLSVGMNRNSALICFGGGVVGDLGGFCAASFMRGIAYIQVPTTLLAQVDAAIGGKTGVNHALGKNLIGAFHQPRKVLINPNFLRSLPEREYSAGMAEIIKAALLDDADFFTWLEQNQASIQARSSQLLAPMISRAAAIKARIVSQDEREQSNLRALLNLGHSFAHALETEYNYERYLHGEAVAIGLNIAAYFSRHLGNISAQCCVRIESLCSAFNLPTACPQAPVAQLLRHMAFDKKNSAGQINLILLKRLGAAYVDSSFSRSSVGELLNSYHQR